jgi:hypothetical protein
MKTSLLPLLLLAACGESMVEVHSPAADLKASGAQGLGIATGVELSQFGAVSVTSVDLCAPGVSVRTTAANERGQTVQAFSNAVGAAAAINGDFFSPSFAVDGIAGHDGNLWSTNDHSYVGPVAFGHNRAGIIPHGDTSGPKAWMREVVSGHPSLVVNGQQAITGNTGDPTCDNRHPRTAVGLSADKRRLFMVVVDGRRPGAPGMRCDELAGLMLSLGAHDAMALDGGGSTTMVAGGAVRNSPSDGQQRKVGNHLAVIATGSGAAAHCPLAAIDENVWVSRLYSRVLGRGGSAGEVDGWAAPVREGAISRGQAAFSFLFSEEHRARRVTEGYDRYLKRAPDSGGLQHHVQANLSRVDLAAGLIGSGEYWGRCGGNDAGFVACLYRDVLGREGSGAEIQGWLPWLAGNGRDAIARAFFGSAEHQGRLVEETYQRLLLRGADPGGHAGWSSFLAGGHSIEELELGFMQSGEFTGP